MTDRDISMPKPSNGLVSIRLNSKIIYEGVAVGRGAIRSIDASRAFLEVSDFPLGANSFLELRIDSGDDTQVNIPARVLRNTGDGLEVEFESVAPGILEALFRNGR